MVDEKSDTNMLVKLLAVGIIVNAVLSVLLLSTLGYVVLKNGGGQNGYHDAVKSQSVESGSSVGGAAAPDRTSGQYKKNVPNIREHMKEMENISSNLKPNCSSEDQNAIDELVMPRHIDIGTSMCNLKWKDKDLSYGGFMNVKMYKADLENANLTGTNMMNGFFRSVVLKNAKMGDINLMNAEMYDVDMSDATLEKADKYDTSLMNAKLHDVNLSNVDLTGVNTVNVELFNVNLEGAKMTEQQADELLKKPNTFTGTPKIV